MARAKSKAKVFTIASKRTRKSDNLYCWRNIWNSNNFMRSNTEKKPFKKNGKKLRTKFKSDIYCCHNCLKSDIKSNREKSIIAIATMEKLTI